MLLPALWEAAALECSGGDIPAAGFKYKPHKAGLHLNFGFLFPIERTAAEFWIKAVIKSFGLVEELLIRKKRCLWPYVA